MGEATGQVLSFGVVPRVRRRRAVGPSQDHPRRVRRDHRADVDDGRTRLRKGGAVPKPFNGVINLDIRDSRD
jgi:hypothetical protein